MIRMTVATLLSATSMVAMAQMTPVGLWTTISDEDKKPTSEVRIVDNGGVLTGKIEKRLDPKAKPDDKCDLCSDDRKDKPILGLEIIRGAKKDGGKDVWEGGKILDPAKGKTYSLILTPIEGGKKLEVRGYIGFKAAGRTQTWIRAQ
jgi:uncharacterized protein (DUF2147 family)